MLVQIIDETGRRDLPVGRFVTLPDREAALLIEDGLAIPAERVELQRETRTRHPAREMTKGT